MDETTERLLINLWVRAMKDVEENKGKPDRLAYVNFLEGIDMAVSVMLESSERNRIKREVKKLAGIE